MAFMNEPMEQEQTWEYQFDELFPELEEWNGDKNAWGEPLFRSRRREVREFIREKLTQARTEERERVKEIESYFVGMRREAANIQSKETRMAVEIVIDDILNKLSSL